MSQSPGGTIGIRCTYGFKFDQRSQWQIENEGVTTRIRGGGGLVPAREVPSWGLEVADAGADLSGMYYNTATFDTLIGVFMKHLERRLLSMPI